MKETKFDTITYLLRENQLLIKKQSILLAKLERKIKQYRDRVTLIVMLFFVIILGILIAQVG